MIDPDEDEDLGEFIPSVPPPPNIGERQPPPEHELLGPPGDTEADKVL